MANTFRANNSISNGSAAVITPPVGELWIVGPGGLFLNPASATVQFGGLVGGTGAVAGNVMLGNLPYKHWIPVTNAYPLKLCNSSGSTVNYLLTGDVTTLAAEGIDSVYGLSYDDAVANLDLLTALAGKAQYMSHLNKNSGSGTIQLIDASGGATLLANMHIYYPDHAHYWLWSELNVTLRAVTSSATDYTVRVARYVEDTTLDEYVNRISVKQSLAAGATYDLIPPADEIWYIDFHNAHAGSWTLNWNGGAGVTSTTSAPLPAFRLSSGFWMRFTNGSAGALTLVVSGTKAKVA